MKFIYKNKIYDTETAELLCQFEKEWETKTVFGIIYPKHPTCLYKTRKGAYFMTYTISDSVFFQLIAEDNAKAYLCRHNFDKYIELFGELEEG